MNYLSEHDVQALGWTLIHSLWQGGVVAIVCMIGLPAVPRVSANARYAFACAMLGAMVIAAGVTFEVVRGARLDVIAGSPEVAVAPEVFGGIAKPQAAAEVAPQVEASARSGAMQWAVLAWVLGVSALSVWHAVGWLWLQRLRAISADVARWEPIVSRLRERMKISCAVRLIECARVDVPAVMGALRPVILLPAGLLSGLSPSQMEAILIHELAHIRRHDYLVNLLQTAAETLMFYHPAVWWISSQIRQERENCCDDVVVKMSGDAIGYAEALAVMEQSRLAPLRLSLAATDGRLIDRVRRMLRLPPTRKTPMRSLAATVLALACGCAPLVASKTEKPKTSTSAETLVVSGPTTTPGVISPADGLTITGGTLVIDFPSGPTTSPSEITATGITITNGTGVVLSGPTTAPSQHESRLVEPPRGVLMVGPPTTQGYTWDGELKLETVDGKLTIHPTYEFIRVVVGKDDLLLDGKHTDMQSLRKMLSDIPAEKRAKTVLEVAAMPDATFGKYEEVFGEMSALVRELKMAYVSNVGIERAAPTTIDAAAREADRQLYLQQKAYREEFDKEFNRQFRNRQSNPPATEPSTRPVSIDALRRAEKSHVLQLDMLKARGIGEKNPAYLNVSDRLDKLRRMIEQTQDGTAKTSPATTKSS